MIIFYWNYKCIQCPLLQRLFTRKWWDLKIHTWFCVIFMRFTWFYEVFTKPMNLRFCRKTKVVAKLFSKKCHFQSMLHLPWLERQKKACDWGTLCANHNHYCGSSNTNMCSGNVFAMVNTTTLCLVKQHSSPDQHFYTRLCAFTWFSAWGRNKIFILRFKVFLCDLRDFRGKIKHT